MTRHGGQNCSDITISDMSPQSTKDIEPAKLVVSSLRSLCATGPEVSHWCSRFWALIARLQILLAFIIVATRLPLAPWRHVHSHDNASMFKLSSAASNLTFLAHTVTDTTTPTMSDSQVNVTLLRRLNRGPMCDLCADNWLFVVASGRSGSTTVVEMLNALPMVYIAGENGGILNELRKVYNTQVDQLMTKDAPPGSAWHHEPISEQRVFCAMQAMIKAIMGEWKIDKWPRMIGYKEVRYSDEKDFNFMSRVFPCARFIVNTRRNTKEQSNSGFYKESNKATQILDKKKMLLRTWQSTHLKRSFALELENFTTKRFNEMLQWLGVSNCKYTQVSHANNGGYEPDANNAKVKGKCEYHGFK